MVEETGLAFEAAAGLAQAGMVVVARAEVVTVAAEMEMVVGQVGVPHEPQRCFQAVGC